MSQQGKFLRFPLYRRIEHWTMVLSFVTLAVTGLIQKYGQSTFSGFMFTLLGGIESVRIIHRVGAVVLMLVAIYHFGDLFYGWYVERVPLSMLPDKEDIIASWKKLRYNLGFEKSAPKQGFFTFEEKFEYWALIWGTIIMGITGFFLWNPIISSKYFPGQWIPAAKAAHSNEALLAVLAVFFWHFYHVLVKHFNTSMFNGTMSREEMEDYHPLVLEEDPYFPPSSKDPRVKHRKRNFTIAYSIVSVAMLAGVYVWVTVEDTAVAFPPQIEEIAEIEVFSPVEPTPFPTPTSVDSTSIIGTTWEGGIADIVAERCGECHKSEGGFAGLDLTSYQGALQGGNSGPAFRPGASGVSLMVIWPARGGHPGEFTPSELAQIRAWIDAGAPEK